ncbi:MAG: rod shape-determining protein MreC [Paludibacteraceae bacterium]|nr:rod shape-determining protein MreC [Paludibacteraceae bacterium]
MRNLLQFIARYSNFLIFLILEVVAFILITTTHQYQNSAVWSSANRFAAGTENMMTTIGDYFCLQQENQRLAEENAQLKNLLMEQANQLEAILERDSQYVYAQLDWDYIPAKVVHITTHKQHNYLTINKGLRDSIQVDMGVVGKDGVVGIVSAVGEKYSLVVPIIHVGMNLSCRLQNNNYIARTQWNGMRHDEVTLQDVSRHVTVNMGDTVVTSGLTNVFPEGIIVGIVAETEITENDNYHRTKLHIATDYKTIKYVQVIRNHTPNQVK